jgi:CRP/FNR family transcriptional regulator, anaerobic regulatory protein
MSAVCMRDFAKVHIPRGALEASHVAMEEVLCSRCRLRGLCLPSGMPDLEVDRLDCLMFARRRICAGQTLYRKGDRFQFVYAVRNGTLKSSLVLADGREQVSGFHIAGELVGLDGAARGHHASAAMALEDTDICAIPFAHLSQLAHTAGSALDVISRMMSREILRESRLMMLLGRIYADERLAAFLLNLAQRFAERGGSGRDFHLPMARAEIGSYLGMKLETVSRTFSAFHRQGLLQVNNRDVRSLDLEGLRALLKARVH